MDCKVSTNHETPTGCCPTGKNSKTLADIVDCYVTETKPGFENYLGEFQTIIDCVCGQVGNEAGKPKYKRNPHQYRIPEDTIEKAEAELSTLFEGKKFGNFEELMNVVDSVEVDGFGNLCRYDFALRYGYPKGVRPVEYVYLQAGAMDGAKALKSKGLLKKTARKVPVGDFPEPLCSLASEHIENLLCIYKDELKQI